MFPKLEMQQRLQIVKPRDVKFTAADDPHGVLADLPFPVFVTTNFDDFLLQALESRNKDPKRDWCRWNFRNEKNSINPAHAVFDGDYVPRDVPMGRSTHLLELPTIAAPNR